MNLFHALKQARQDDLPPSRLRVEINYAAVQGSYCAGSCALTTFTAVFLSWNGFSDRQIGYTASLIYGSTMLLQLLLASFMDRHPSLPLRRAVAALSLAAFGLAAMLSLLPLPLLCMMAAYTLCCALDNSRSSLLAAVMMQYLNRGIPVRYGWPRGIGSISYALLAALLGTLMERYSPAILLPFFLGFDALSLLFLLLMPDPGKAARVQNPKNQISYLQMLRGNPALTLLLCACALSAMGQCCASTYLVRVVEALGGGEQELGIAILLQSGVELPAMLLSSRLLKRWSPQQLLTFALFATAGKLILILLSSSLVMLYLVLLTSVCCFGIYGFAAVLFANSLVPEEQAVRVQSLLALSYTSGVGGILGNLLGGTLIQSIGLKPLLFVSAMLCACGAGVMLVCVRYRRAQAIQK